MPFDYKKEYKEMYMPPKKPGIIDIPEMNFLAVRGVGDPNQQDGEYSRALNMLYGVAYTIKMSYKNNFVIDGYFQYAMPPLEGFWWQPGVEGVDYSRKQDFHWISVIRLPDFVKEADFQQAVHQATLKKKQDFSKVEFYTYTEGLCVQCMHRGSYDDEPATVAMMDDYAVQQGYQLDIGETRQHHEIYLNDARKTAKENLKTVIRHPIKKDLERLIE